MCVWSRADVLFLRRVVSGREQEGKLVKVFTNVESKVKRHSQEVLDALKEIEGLT